MNKGGVLVFVFVFLFILNAYCSLAALGLGPATTEVNFYPNINFSAGFIVRGADPEQKLQMYATGDLAQYVEFSRKNLTGDGSFGITVRLPGNIEKVGENRLIIGVKEVIDEEEGGIGTALAVEVLVAVHVPYYGKYARISSFTADDVNIGEPVKFNVEVNNLGQENITADVYIEVYDSENKRTEILNLGSKFMPSQTRKQFRKSLNTTGYKPGVYNATAILYYGEAIRAEKIFKIGNLFVNITDFTTQFKKGKINKFDIKTESFWNSKTSNIFAEVKITSENGTLIDTFKTPSISVEPWGKATLTGYLNAESLDIGTYNASVYLFYEENQTKKSGNIYVVEERGLNMVLILVISLIIAVLIIVILGWLVFKKHGKKERKRK